MENQLLDAPLETSSHQHGEYASFPARLVALLIDAIIVFFAQYAVLGVLLLAFSSAEENPEIISPERGVILAIAEYLLFLLAQATYFAWFESSGSQATPGKQAMGLVVTDLKGKRISILNAFGRFFAKVFSTLIFMAGYLVQPFTERRQALHDLVAGTLVYKK